MVQFQNNLENARLPEWAPQYVNYSLLKLKLKDIIAVKDNDNLQQVCQARKFIFQGTALQKPKDSPSAALDNIRHFAMARDITCGL